MLLGKQGGFPTRKLNALRTSGFQFGLGTECRTVPPRFVEEHKTADDIIRPSPVSGTSVPGRDPCNCIIESATFIFSRQVIELGQHDLWLDSGGGGGRMTGPALNVKNPTRCLSNSALQIASQGDVVVVDVGGDLTSSLMAHSLGRTPIYPPKAMKQAVSPSRDVCKTRTGTIAAMGRACVLFTGLAPPAAVLVGHDVRSFQ